MLDAMRWAFVALFFAHAHGLSFGFVTKRYRSLLRRVMAPKEHTICTSTELDAYEMPWDATTGLLVQ